VPCSNVMTLVAISSLEEPIARRSLIGCATARRDLSQMLASSDQQISLTDSDSRSMATSGRGSGVVGYNVQVAVDT